MIVLVPIFLLCLTLQNLFIGQQQREIFSVTKLLAVYAAERVHVANPVPDATDSFIIHLNTAEPNGAAQINTDAHSNDTGLNSTNTIEAVSTKAPLTNGTIWIKGLLDFLVDDIGNSTANFNRWVGLDIKPTHIRERLVSFADVLVNATEAFNQRHNGPRTWKHAVGYVGIGILVLYLLVAPFWDLIPDDLLTFSTCYSDSMERILGEKDDEYADLLSGYAKLNDKYEILLQRNGDLEKDRDELKKELDGLPAGVMKLLDRKKEIIRRLGADDTQPPNGNGSSASDPPPPPPNNSDKKDGFDKKDTGSCGPKEQFPGDIKPEEPSTSPDANPNTDSTTENSRPHGSKSDPDPAPAIPRDERDEELRRRGAPLGPKGWMRKQKPVDASSQTPNTETRSTLPKKFPNGKSGNFRSFPNCPPGPLKPSDESKPPPSTEGKPDSTVPKTLGDLARSMWAGKDPKPE